MLPPLILLNLAVLLLRAATNSQHPPHLSTAYYTKTCPQFEQIVQDTTTHKQISSPTTVATLRRVRRLRPHLHHPFQQSRAQRRFDIAVRARTALELTCPGIVSCTDILAVAARNLVVMTGGPFYDVKLG